MLSLIVVLFMFMRTRALGSTRTDTLFPYTTLSRTPARRGGARQGGKAARFIHGVADGAEGAAQTDEVQEIAVLAGRGGGPLAHRARTGGRAVKAAIETDRKSGG